MLRQCQTNREAPHKFAWSIRAGEGFSGVQPLQDLAKFKIINRYWYFCHSELVLSGAKDAAKNPGIPFAELRAGFHSAALRSE
jgi:hypothetical protein